MRLTRLAKPALLTASLLALLWGPSAHAALPVQPGIQIESGGSGCTASFVYDGAGQGNSGKVFIGTAGHCVAKIGDAVRNEEGETFASVAFIGNAEDLRTDYAFLEVLPAFADRVSPAVKGHPNIPAVGVATPADTRPGDAIQISGYGTAFELLPATRERRTAQLTGHSDRYYEIFGPITQGDSGGPLVHLASGRALGVISRLCFGLSCLGVHGPSVQGIIAHATAGGFPVRLRTVAGSTSSTSAGQPPAAPSSRRLATSTARVRGQRVRLALVATPAKTRLELARRAGSGWRTVDRRAVRGFDTLDGFRALRVRGGRRSGRATVVWTEPAGERAKRSYAFTQRGIARPPTTGGA